MKVNQKQNIIFMNDIRKKSDQYNCRVCFSNNIKKFNFTHYTFKFKNKNWNSFVCFECGSVSEFKINGNEIKYDDGSYRELVNHFDISSKENKIIPPIDLWSAVSFKRWEHIYKLIQKNSFILNKQNLKMLDYGGYNGFLSFAFNQKNKINSFVADLDPQGLKMAKFLGSEIINIKNETIKELDFDLITFVHVLEHLDNPKSILENLKNNLSKNGILYAEVPNLYGFPLTDESHKLTFTIHSLSKLFEDSGYNIIKYGYATTPEESLKLGYYYNNNKENLFVIATKEDITNKILLHKPIIPRSIKSFQLTLFMTYAYIMLNSICFNLLKLSMRYFRTFILFLIYGLLEVISIKIFRFSLVNTIIKNLKKIF